MLTATKYPLRHSRMVELGEVVDRVYSAATDACAWEDAVEQVRTVLGGSTACLLRFDGSPSSQGTSLISRQLTGDDQHRFWPNALQSRMSEQVRKLGRPEDAVIAWDGCNRWRDLVAQIDSECYREFFCPRDIHDAVAVILDKGTDTGATVAVYVWGGEGKRIGLEDRLTLAAIAPHLKRAHRLGEMLAEREGWRTAFAAALDRIHIPIFFVEAGLRLAHANASGENLLSAGDGLRAVSGRLRCGMSNEHSQLLRRVSWTVEGRPEGPGTVQIGRPSGRANLIATIMPAAGCDAGLGTRTGPLAIVTVVEPDGVPAPALPALERGLGLTPGEARVMGELVRGLTPAEIAQTSGLAIRTVRDYISRLLMKTGTRRQSDLVRLGLLHVPLLEKAR